MTPDSDLPVWTIRPNWSNGITETLEWLTFVPEASDGNEQGIAMRLSPRRTFEMTFNPYRMDRTYLDLWLHKYGAGEFMLPLWHDRAKLTAAIASGVTIIPIDTTFREFAIGDRAVIVDPDNPHVFDAGEIIAMSAASITLDNATDYAWPVRASVYPLRRTRIAAESNVSALTSRVGEATIRFELNQGNDFEEDEWTGLTYADMPVITIPPNRSDNIDLTFMRKAHALDNNTGLRHLTDDAGRAFTIQTHNWMAVGREQHVELRSMLYRLRGRQTPVWLPTFNDDVRIARVVGTTHNYLHVDKIGYAYTGGVKPGRDRLLINNTTPVRITGLGTALATTEERLNLQAAVGAEYAPGTYASFMDAVRLVQDAIEIHHHTDTDGVCEVKAAFKSFTNTRVAPTVIDYPIPTTEMTLGRCGAPAEDDGICIPIESKWWRLRVQCRFEGRHGDPITDDPDIGVREFHWWPSTPRTINGGSCPNPVTTLMLQEAIQSQGRTECVNGVSTVIVRNESLDPDSYGFQYTVYGNVPLILPTKFYVLAQYDLGTWSDVGLPGTPLDFYFMTEGYPESLIYTSFQNHGGAHHHRFDINGNAIGPF